MSLFDGPEPIPHTHLGQTADLILVAPATAKTLGKYAAGISDDLLTATLLATRPTAVNLFWAIDRMKRAFADAATAGASVDQITARLELEARHIHDEDVASCRAMGAYGAAMSSEFLRS